MLGLVSPNNIAKDLTAPAISQQGPKLVATGLPAYANQGYSVSVSLLTETPPLWQDLETLR